MLTAGHLLPNLPVQSRKKWTTEVPLKLESTREIGILSFYDSGLDIINFMDAHVAQLVEHVLGKDEVISSILIMGSS